MDILLRATEAAAEVVEEDKKKRDWDPDYFNTEYRAYSIGLGCVWTFTWIFPFIMYAIVNPNCLSCTYTAGTKHAWNTMRYTTLVEFGLLSVVWSLSYIRLKAFQKMYYRFIAWMIPVSWFFALWVMIAMLIGGSQDGGSVGRNALHATLFWVITGGMEMIAWFLAKGNVLYYKWNEKDWWNYNPEESPGNWPD